MSRKQYFSIAVLVVSMISCSAGNLAASSTNAGLNFSSTKSLRAMARVYMAAGEYEKAEPLLSKALANCQSGSSTDEELCLSLLDTSWLYQKQFKYDQALQYCQMGLQLQEKLYFTNHPYIGYTLRNLSAIYNGQGKYNEARSTMDRAMKLMYVTHEVDDPALASFKADLADIMASQGDLAGADNMYRAALAQISIKFGSEHLYTAQVMAGYGKVCLLEGRYFEAQSMLEKSLDIQRAVFGRGSHLLAGVSMTLAEVLMAREQYDQAREHLEGALASVRTKYGIDNPMTGKVMSLLGHAYLGSGQVSKAEKTAREAVDILERSAAKSDSAATAKNRLAQVYISKGKLDKAAQLCSESLAELETLLGSEHPRIAAVLDTMALLSSKAGDLDAAAVYTSRAMAIRALGGNGLSAAAF
ncbi:MAG: hypothetical protein A2Y07_02795 [Planctomycetes bacterium GWF2_50_10]|nr:MAG: hypothetical protein A2Y07_02795 [Planctomycetes bacterium GWF2_50_10]